jgi:crotonobetainyl-CoA:carnitine CoA-transferase CaiB-like acyl-CoA transferase
VNISIPQSYLHAGADAAVGSLIAYYQREKSGYGQHVDVSGQHSTAWFLANAIPFWELEGQILGRAGHYRKGLSAEAVQRQVWKCKDGHVFFVMMGGMIGAKTCRALAKWMEKEGETDEYVKNVDWERLDIARVTQEEIDRITAPIEKFFLGRTKKELWEGAVQRRMALCPLFEPEDLLNDPQLKARDFWVDVNHPELGTSLPYPKEFVKVSGKTCGIQARAPLIGEHNTEVYGELGFSLKELTILKECGVI